MTKDRHGIYFSINMVTISDRNSIRNERFSSAHGSRWFNLLLQGRCGENRSGHSSESEWLSCSYHAGTSKLREPVRTRCGF